jgi:hypothetical protein
MKITREELYSFEELHRWGTPLDATVLEEARAECRGLEVVQNPNWIESLVFPRASGGVDIMVSLEIVNVSNRVIPLKQAHLDMPWPDADFHWLKKPSSKEVREWGGYLPASFRSYGFDPTVVLNHHFGRDSKLHPGVGIEGLLLGEGRASVPDEYRDRMLVPARLIVFTGKGDSYGAWMKLAVMREGQPRRRKSVGEEVQGRTAREKLFA